jgi:PAS domain S-box-containing protein
MVARVDSTLPLAMCTPRAQIFYVPRSFLVCLLSLWLTLSTAQALDPNKRLTQYAHTAWRIQDGFLPNTPFWISQTKDGYLWVGGGSGALRFDGVRFTPWSAPIASPPILHPVSVRAGEFWIVTRSELAHVRDNVVISHYDIPGIDAIYKDSDGSVWALSYPNPDRVLCQATDTKIRCFGKAEGITIHEASSFLPDGKGGFWIGGDTLLLHWKMGAAPEIYSPQQLQSNVGQIGINSLLEDSDGSLWVGIMAAGPGLGLERFRNGVLTPVALPNFDGTKVFIHGMIEDSDQNLWIATFGNGVYRIHGRTVDHFGRADGLSSDTVFDLYEGDDGTVWAATSDGIDNFRDLPVTTFSSFKGLGPTGAASVMATKDGTVWVASLGTLHFVRKGAVSSVRVPGQQVGSLLEDHLGNIWVGVDDGLFIYKDGRFRRIPEADHHPLGLVVGITEDVEGNIWAECKGAQRKLIRIRDFKVREEFSEAQVPRAHAIAADPKGGIWLGTLTGDLTFFREDIARTFPLKLSGKSWAYQIAVDPDGSVITASDDGLVMLRAGKVQRLGKENGLPCDGVHGFVVDDNRNLWLNTPCGFIEIAASDVQRWWIHPDTMVQARLFGTLDGALPGRVSFNPAAKSPDGRLWFVNNVVLQMIDPSRLSGDRTVSPVYIETVVADRKQYKPQESLQLPPLTRDLQIGYTSPSFLIPQKVKFRYRLDGHDRDWQDADTRREAFYTELGPGKYRFRVIACNNKGVWNEAGAALDFAIAPAYWQTNWFHALCVLALLALVYGAYRFRVRQLRRQEKKLRDVVETIPTFAWTALPDGALDFINHYWVEYTGLSAEKTMGSGWKAAVHPADLPYYVERRSASVASGEPFEHEVRFRCAVNGEYRWFLSRSVPLRDSVGKIVKWYGISTDIEDRKRSEEALQRSQFYINEGQRVAHMGSWAFNADGFEYWSSELFQIHGLEASGKPPTVEEYLALAHPEDRAFVKQGITNMLADHRPFDFTKRIVRRDGEIRSVRCVGVPVMQGGTFHGFLGTGMDVTEQERLTEELRRSESHLAEAQRLAHTGSWAWRVADRKTVHLSEEFYRICGFDPAEGSLTLEQCSQRVHPEDRLKWKGIIERAIVEKADYDREFRLLLPNGAVKWVHTVGHPVFSSAGDLEGFVGSSTDITALKSAEQERERLRQLEADLAHTNRVSTLGEMAASLAHEIKQPIAAAITTANSCIEWLAQEPPNLDRARAAAARIDKYGNRAAEIIDRIRSLYRKSPPQRELVDVNGIIEEMLTLLKGEASRYLVAMRTELTTGPSQIMADRVQLQQVFMNLMLNAIEAMKNSGGELTVKSQLQDGQLLFSVSDTGPGLPSGNVDQIFSAFFTTKPQGSGLGLAISRSIVESHGGRLWATPNDGHGATFHFSLPIHVTESALVI